MSTEPLPPVASGPVQTFSVAVGPMLEAGHMVNEPAEHDPAVFRVSLGVENVLVPDVIDFLRGWHELFARMEIEEREVLAVFLDQTVSVSIIQPFF